MSGEFNPSEESAPVLPYKFLKLPLIQQFGGGVTENLQMRLIGRTFEDARRFSIRIACGEKKSDDAPFILTSDTKNRKVTVSTNNISANCSGNDLVIFTDYFKPASEFDIRILSSADAFEVRFGDETHKWDHKMAYYTARYMIVEGDINLQSTPISGLGQGEENKRISLSLELGGNVTDGRRIIVQGSPVKAHPYKMMIDFMTDLNHLAFHFNPRFDDKLLIRNNLINNSWKTEERSLLVPFPFVYGVAFQLLFTLSEGRFDVDLNGHHLCTFVRQTPGRVIEMQIHGSVVISKAECIEGNPSHYGF